MVVHLPKNTFRTKEIVKQMANAYKNPSKSPIISLNSSWNITFWWQKPHFPSISFVNHHPHFPWGIARHLFSPPVAKAMSCRIAVFRAPKAGALIATTSKMPRCLLRTKVCRAWQQTDRRFFPQPSWMNHEWDLRWDPETSKSKTKKRWTFLFGNKTK